MKSPAASTLHHGDCLAAIPTLAPCTFRIIYIDPPFFTESAFKNRKGTGGFSDTWNGSLEDYLAFLRPRVTAMRELLMSDGSFLLHLDWRAVHYAKVMCDEIFGRANFQNEIIWSYNSGGGTKHRYGRKHDTILWYGKTAKPFFDADAARVPHSAVIATKRAHLFHPGGKVRGDVLDIPRPPNHSAEWTGWPTQKPLALLQLLIRCQSRPGDLIGDFFCGSGTTLVAAFTEGRKAFGCDLSEDALGIARKRIAAIESS
ncbi:MAG: site-specific DNA-methyltransferase [Candidatus Sumerlaeota bacterium]